MSKSSKQDQNNIKCYAKEDDDKSKSDQESENEDEFDEGSNEQMKT